MNKDVIVVLESGEGAEAVNRGLLAEGGRIADLLGGRLFALTAAIPEGVPFRLLLFAHSDNGRELATLSANMLDASAVLDCFDIRFRNESLYYVRYVHGGQFEQEVSFANPPEIASMRIDSLVLRTGAPAASAPFEKIAMQIPETVDAKKILRTIPPDYRTIDIRFAKRILDIGAGCDEPGLLKLAEELSHLLEASLGTTRVVVDNGHIVKARMIGQTGKTVAPELCLALGASGSPHHIAGFQKAAKIFAVNSDARAPIFGISDAGFVSDLNSLLPKLINRIKQYRDEGSRENA